MDLNNIYASVGTTVLTIGGVSAFIAKYIPNALKSIKVAHKALDLVEDIVDAAQDRQLTAQEVEKIIADADALRETLK